MILYTAIKYKILDYCLESLFNALVMNFSNLSVEHMYCTELRIGMKMKKLEFLGFWWNDVEILGIKKSNKMANEFTVSCSSYNHPWVKDSIIKNDGSEHKILIFYHTRIAIYN